MNYTSKEVSWLSFNERVLQEAANPDVPLIERIKFLGICSSNIDEFYRVRVATLNRLIELGKKAKKLINADPKEVLKEVTVKALKQHSKFDKTLKEIQKELIKNKIYFLDETQLNDEQSDFVRSYFIEEVRPNLIPIMIDQVDKFPELKDRTIYLAIYMYDSSSSKKQKYALIEVPTDINSRFLILPSIDGKQHIILLDDVIRYNLQDIFSIFAFDEYKAYTIKITRDAEFDIGDSYTQTYIEKMSKSLKQRKGGNAIRLIYDSAIPEDFLKFLMKKMNIDKSDTLIAGSKYHNNRDFMDFPKIGSEDLRYPSIKPLPHKDINTKTSMFEIMSQKDLLLHYPYHSFDYVIDLLREASIDPQVISIKFTIYRVAKQSSVMNALINAKKNGKSVLTVLELRARFDEESNIHWANKLQDEGIKVVFGIPGLKVHSKLCLITRKEKDKKKHYAIIGTGNFHEDTAKIYSDHNLFTADSRITQEVSKLFDFFENTYKNFNFKHLIVSPFNLRKKLIRFIKTEIKNAQNGKEAYIHVKVNGLVDPPIIEKLYEASQAGVQIRLNVRGMFSLVTGIEGVSTNIEAIGIVDKFLEHTRIYIFCNGGEERYFISSADWMPRNIDRRVEVTCPIYDKEIQKELRTFFDLQWKDNIKARLLNQKLDNKIRINDLNEPFRAQREIYEYLKNYHCQNEPQS
ncbi:polyphosphate kinase 1 [Calditrichota bacterium]